MTDPRLIGLVIGGVVFTATSLLVKGDARRWVGLPAMRGFVLAAGAAGGALWEFAKGQQVVGFVLVLLCFFGLALGFIGSRAPNRND
jgi:hypothetical protein